jgi:hypothetical protein
MRRSIGRALAAVGFLGLAAFAKDANAGPIDEVWVGGFAHNVSRVGDGAESGTEDVILEIDTGRPKLLRFLGAPRVNAVIELNSAGRTNLGSLGLVWDHRIFHQLYGTLDFGLGLSDGVTDPPAGPAGDYDRAHRILLGSSVLFRGAAGLEWRLSDRWAIGAEYVHASNGDILGAHQYNRGVNDAGLRLGYRFH